MIIIKNKAKEIKWKVNNGYFTDFSKYVISWDFVSFIGVVLNQSNNSHKVKYCVPSTTFTARYWEVINKCFVVLGD